MSKTTLKILSSILLATAIAAPAVAHQRTLPPGRLAGLPRYMLFDVGTFGGPLGYYSNPASRSLNSSGANAGGAETAASDPFCPDWCFGDGNVMNGFEWQGGTTTQLGALKSGYSSFANSITAKGVPIGVSQTGDTDPATGAPVTHGVIWMNGTVTDLGTLGGTQSQGFMGNRSGQIINESSTSDSNDPYIGVPMANCLWLPNNGTACGELDFGINSFFLPVTTQSHAAIWSASTGSTDIGTLGGPDALAYDMNNNGQVVGWSYTSYDAGPSGVPDTHPFIWDPTTRAMTDLGTLGGTFAAAMLINKHGQVVGASNLSGDTVVHPFVWDASNGMQDLGSFGGWYSHPNWINDRGDVVGISSYPDNTRRAFYWHNGTLNDLGTIGTDDRSVALSINNHGIIAGYTFTNGGDEIRGFIANRTHGLIDVNTLIDNLGDYYVIAAYYVNNGDEVVGIAALPDGEVHPVVLVPDTAPALLAQMGAHSHQPTRASGFRHSAARPHVRACAPGRMASRFCAEP